MVSEKSASAVAYSMTGEYAQLLRRRMGDAADLDQVAHHIAACERHARRVVESWSARSGLVPHPHSPPSDLRIRGRFSFKPAGRESKSQLISLAEVPQFLWAVVSYASKDIRFHEMTFIPEVFDGFIVGKLTAKGRCPNLAFPNVEAGVSVAWSHLTPDCATTGFHVSLLS